MEHELRDGVLQITITGEPATPELLSLLRKLAQDPTVPDGLHVLIDVRQAKGGPPRHDLEAVSDFFSQHRAAYPRVGLLVKSPLQYGLARVGQALNQNRGFDLEIFRTEKAALLAFGKPGAAE